MVNLRTLHPSDVSFFRVWWRDKELIKTTSGDFSPLSDEQIGVYFDAMLASVDDIHRMITVKNDKTIGHISLIKRRDAWHEIQIVIGDKSSQNKGYGTEAVCQMIALAKDLHIVKIYLDVRPENARAIKSYQNAGFRVVDNRLTSSTAQPCLVRMEFK